MNERKITFYATRLRSKRSKTFCFVERERENGDYLAFQRERLQVLHSKTPT